MRSQLQGQRNPPRFFVDINPTSIIFTQIQHSLVCDSTALVSRLLYLLASLLFTGMYDKKSGTSQNIHTSRMCKQSLNALNLAACTQRLSIIAPPRDKPDSKGKTNTRSQRTQYKTKQTGLYFLYSQCKLKFTWCNQLLQPLCDRANQPSLFTLNINVH